MSGDIGTSYPSPISTAGSPNIEETSRQPVVEPQGQGRPDTQHNLRAASAALQAAYRRIRQGQSVKLASLGYQLTLLHSPTKPHRIRGTAFLPRLSQQ